MHSPSNSAVVFLFILSVLWTATVASSVALGCSAGWDKIGTHCYNFVNIKMDYEDARNACQNYGATLLVVRDEVEAKDVSSMAIRRLSGDRYWIYNGGQNKDSLNSTFCQGIWQPDEPKETNEDAAVASNMQGRWAVTWVWTNLPFICRTPACPIASLRCSDGTCLNKKWECDGAFDCQDQSDESNCKDNIKYYKQSSGTIDTTGLANHGNYQWIIEGQPGEVLRVEFETVTIEDHVDSVRVYTGGPSIITSELIQEIRSSLSEQVTVLGKNHFLIITLQSDATNFKPTFKASWSPDTEASWKQVETVIVSDTQATISSPYFNSDLAPKSFKREWLLTAPEGELITLEVLENTFEQNASSDIYIITNVGFVLKELNSNKAVYISSKNSMSVIIKTNSGKKLFNARYKTGCDFTTELSLATFSVIDLPANLTCSWEVVNALGTDFRLSINKTSGFLQLYNGTDTNSDMVIGTYDQNNVGVKEFSSLFYGVSFKFVSDNVESGIAVEGTISADCPEIYDSNMIVTYGKTSGAGKPYDVQITCKNGFTFRQEEYSKNKTLHAVCKEGGKWDWGSSNYIRTPECQVVYCGFPPPITNGLVSNITRSVTQNAVATYQCFPGFTIVGSDIITCQADGSWSLGPICVARTCPQVPLVSHGNFTKFGDLSEGTVISFSCDPGYDLQGPQQIVCLSSQSWSHSPSICEALTCPMPVIKYGHYQHAINSLPKYGDLVGLYCDTGYQINRTQSQSDNSITCSMNRKLSVDNDICVDVDECSNSNMCSISESCINTDGSFHCVCKSGYSGPGCKDVDECALGICHQNCTNLPGSYYCTCQEGYILYTNNGISGFNIPPGEDGLKSGDVFQINKTCVPIRCNGEPEVPENGYALTIKSQYFYNEKVEILCDIGYELHGSSFATCQSNGNWTYSVTPTCTSLACLQPRFGKYEIFRVPATGPIEPFHSLIIACGLNDGSMNTINKTMLCAPSSQDFRTFSLQGDNPNCPEVDCGKPWSIPGSKFNSVTSTTYGSSFEFGCDANRGFKMVGLSTQGNSTVICLQNGQWGYASLTCEGPRCKDPGTLSGTIQIVNTSYEIDQIVKYNCTKPGFTPVPYDKLVCAFNNGNPSWNGNPPACIDTEPPVITCPKLPPFDLFNPLVYPIPTATDNSGFSCLHLESGPPSGVIVVSKNLTVKYKATDSKNEAVCEFNVALKDYTGPEIKCFPTIQKDLGGNINEMYNLTEALLQYHSGDGTVIFDPVGPISLTVGSVVPVRARITKSNGLFKECAFLINAISTTCLNNSLTPPEYGRIEQCVGDGSRMTCTAVCNDGYLFQSSLNSSNYDCRLGTWSLKLPLQPCVKLSDTTFNFDVTLGYKMSGHKLPPSPQYDSTICLDSQYSKIIQLVESMSVCGYDNWIATNVKRDAEIDLSTDAISFTLQLSNSNGDETSLADCADEILRRAETLFGPTTPATGSKSCFSPWTVDLTYSSVVKRSFSCDTSSTLLTDKGKKYCLPCGPGMFVNDTVCQECSDGFYQDGEKETACKQCPNGILHSYQPRTKQSHCYDLCPSGFVSRTGYIIDTCTSCPENYFSSNLSSSCNPCPKNGSTLGISGAKSESECSEPCPVGQYSVTGYLPCSSCPQHFYSNITGAHICTECPSSTYTTGSGSAFYGDCKDGSVLCTANFCNSVGSNTNCQIVDHRPTCFCKPGYYGDSCDKSCDVCSPNPCYNGGTCTALDGFNFSCACKNVFDGPLCERDLVNDCSDTVCTSLDFCMDLVGGTKCQCPQGGNYDSKCAKSVDLCQGIDCSFHGHCVSYGSVRSVCDCNPGYTGDNCEINIDECSLNSYGCLYNGTCNDGINSYSCSCINGFSGAHCEVLANLCDSNDCQVANRGFCNRDFQNHTARCTCGEHYMLDPQRPDVCNPINYCTSNPCLNGTCIDIFGGFRCDCFSGFEGSHCQHNIDDCINHRCQNGAACNDAVSTYSCDCLPGFTGYYCDSNIDDCSYSCVEENLEQNCIDLVADFYCPCKPEFTGKNCSVDVDECSVLDPCLHGGHCTNFYGGYNCTCPPGWTGVNCELEPNYCSSNPCLNKGQCYNLLDQFYCQCQNGTSGSNCEQGKNVCEQFNDTVCTVNGKCELNGETASCECLGETICTFYEYPTLQFTSNNSIITFTENEQSKCEELCLQNINCVAYLVESDTYCYHYNTLLNGTIANHFKSYAKKCTEIKYHSGKACEFQKDHCANNPCNGGICTLSNSTFVCNCSNVKNVGGELCDKPLTVCENCPQNMVCRQFLDQDGYLNYACMCPHGYETFVGDKCQTLDTNYDLAFLENFADKNTFVTSERGFYLEKNSNLSVTMWVAAAKKLNNDSFILGLRSSSNKDHFLRIFNTKVQIRLSQSSAVEFPLADVIGHSLDESFIWHLISISWSTNGSLKIVFDFLALPSRVVNVPPPSEEYVLIDLGQSFYGYISQVSVWKSALTTEEIYDMFNDRSYVPQINNLLLGWTAYSYDSFVQRTEFSTAADAFSICEIPFTIAKKGLDSPECKSKFFIVPDKTPPEFNFCNESVVIPTDYTIYQISSSVLEYAYTDKPGELPQYPERQYFSYGAYDIAVTGEDSEGNVGICMTRAYITPHKCSDTEPSSNLTKCSGNSLGIKGPCPPGMISSVPTPKFVTCGKLQTYNLDNIYEKPDRIVCGASKPKTTTVNLLLPYTIQVDCDRFVLAAFSTTLKFRLMNLSTTWTGLCSEPTCNDVVISGNCSVDNSVHVRIQLSAFSDYLNRTIHQTLERMNLSDAFDVSNIGGAKLESGTQITAAPSCARGYGVSGNGCVQCGLGSYYDELEMKCKLCELNSYSDSLGIEACKVCPNNRVTFQRGSSSANDCKERCQLGQMFNGTIDDCVACPMNFYQDQEGKSYCFPCPPTLMTRFEGSTKQNDCIII